MADRRAHEALEQIVSGQKLPRREPKTAYNGASGVPIREEILARHGDAVVTRNGYGAHCLNTPDVFFADIDFEQRPVTATGFGFAIVLVAIGLFAGSLLASTRLAVIFAVLALVLAFPIARAVHRLKTRVNGGAEQEARKRIASFLQGHPDWKLGLYRTPAGLRLIGLHRVFDPTAPEVAAAFEALGVDPVYATMCKNQHCFRARLSPKPWRIGISAHMRPRPGVWPVNPKFIDLRQQWVREYEAAAATYAACRFVEVLGSGRIDSKAEQIRALHDRLSQAREDRQIA